VGGTRIGDTYHRILQGVLIQSTINWSWDDGRNAVLVSMVFCPDFVYGVCILVLQQVELYNFIEGLIVDTFDCKYCFDNANNLYG
jgi:hypothetical protein